MPHVGGHLQVYESFVAVVGSRGEADARAREPTLHVLSDSSPCWLDIEPCVYFMSSLGEFSLSFPPGRRGEMGTPTFPDLARVRS